MEIRKADINDLDAIMKIYDCARDYMVKNNNPTQWGDGYPERELLEDDIQKQQCYVCLENGIIHGVFVFIIGIDATYIVIEDGAWINDEPYGTIHRIASDGMVHGIFKQSIDFCKEQVDNLRIDTHEDNKTMQHLILKNGFTRCGIIYVRDGSGRIAYQRVSKHL